MGKAEKPKEFLDECRKENKSRCIVFFQILEYVGRVVAIASVIVAVVFWFLEIDDR
jgi:hypothetical protein